MNFNHATQNMIEMNMKHTLMTIMNETEKFPNTEIITTFLGEMGITNEIAGRIADLIIHHRRKDKNCFSKILEKCIKSNGVNSPIVTGQGQNIEQNVISENVIISLESMIEPFTVNNVFEKFESFSLATLQLFKTMGKPMYDLRNWSSGTLKRWNDTFRDYCQKYFETYAGNEMMMGDLLDWWETRRDDLVQVMEEVLNPVGESCNPIMMLKSEDTTEEIACRQKDSVSFL